MSKSSLQRNAHDKRPNLIRGVEKGAKRNPPRPYIHHIHQRMVGIVLGQNPPRKGCFGKQGNGEKQNDGNDTHTTTPTATITPTNVVLQ